VLDILTKSLKLAALALGLVCRQAVISEIDRVAKYNILATAWFQKAGLADWRFEYRYPLVIKCQKVHDAWPQPMPSGSSIQSCPTPAASTEGMPLLKLSKNAISTPSSPPSSPSAHGAVVALLWRNAYERTSCSSKREKSCNSHHSFMNGINLSGGLSD